jgi:asparagine synthase (glutamine-hydrolysing)
VSFERDLSDPANASVLDTMTGTMSRRGPDASGVWHRRHAALGHHRLAIIDLDGGVQPMTVDGPDGTVAITYSGEVYNFAALRSELRRRGQRFRTSCDTEVVLLGYLEWGTDVVHRLNGMYAFAIWDARIDRLLLVRDHVGIKPLYYHRTTDGILFGSEPKVILANPVVEPTVGLDGLREIFTGVRRAGTTVYEAVQELRPGTMLTLDRSGLREHTYWQLTAREHTDDYATTVATVRELLSAAVDRQLVADVPLCTLLSGGLDSSAITARAAVTLGAHQQQVRSFSVGFLGQDENFAPDAHNVSSDNPFIEEVARHVHSAHRHLVLDPAELADPAIRRASVTARDMPVGLGDMDNSLYLLFRAIREHSTVALSGEGADEVFGGYWWFHDVKVSRAAAFPWLYALTGQARQERPYGPPELMAALQVADYAEQVHRESVAAAPVVDGEDEAQTLWRRQLHLHLTNNLQFLLDRKDRLSMAVGLEVRVPFCDPDLLQYAANISYRMAAADGHEKSVLRAAMGHLLPASVVARRKSPYPRTQDVAYVAALQNQAAELLVDPGHEAFSLVDPHWVRHATSRPAAGMDLGFRMALERLLDIGVWLQNYRPTIKLS